MRVAVELIAFIQKYALDGKSVFEMELDDGSTVNTVLNELGIPKTEPLISLLNGKHAKNNTDLHDGDKLILLTPVEGG